jgi:hypothetical protein
VGNDDIGLFPATQLARLCRAKAVSSVEVTQDERRPLCLS